MKTNNYPNNLFVEKINPTDTDATKKLLRVGFYPVEQALHISFDLSTWLPENFTQNNQKDYALIKFQEKYKKYIKNIAKRAFTADRFHLDTNIPRKYANYRYEQWIENSLNAKEEVWILINKEKIACGFFITKKEHKATNLRLAAINPRLVGNGIGKLLYFLMFKTLKKRGVTNVETQISLNNVAVFNVYTYLVHPKITSVFAVFHKIV